MLSRPHPSLHIGGACEPCPPLTRPSHSRIFSQQGLSLIQLLQLHVVALLSYACLSTKPQSQTYFHNSTLLLGKLAYGGCLMVRHQGFAPTNGQLISNSLVPQSEPSCAFDVSAQALCNTCTFGLGVLSCLPTHRVILLLGVLDIISCSHVRFESQTTIDLRISVLDSKHVEQWCKQDKYCSVAVG